MQWCSEEVTLILYSSDSLFVDGMDSVNSKNDFPARCIHSLVNFANIAGE